MARKSGKEIAEKLIRKAQAAGEDYVKGVRNPRKSPMQAAIAQKGKMVARFNEAINSGKWEDGLNSISDKEWSDITAKKGSERYAAGLAEASQKTADFFDEFMPYVEQVQAEADRMDTSTLEGAIAKSAFVQRALAKFKRTRRRRA